MDIIKNNKTNEVNFKVIILLIVLHHSSANGTGREGAGGVCDGGASGLDVPRRGGDPVLRDPVQAKVRQPGLLGDLGGDHHVLHGARPQPLHRVRALCDRRERRRTRHPQRPGSGHHWRNRYRIQ